MAYLFAGVCDNIAGGRFGLPVAALLAVATLLAVAAIGTSVYRLWVSPLRRVPGPPLFALTRWRLAWEDWRGTRTRCIDALHAQYGPAVRIAPDEVSFASLEALRTIYGAGSGFERTAFYRMFDVYGEQNLFSFAGVRAHAERKKLLAHAYAKSAVLAPGGPARGLLQRNVEAFLQLVACAVDEASPRSVSRPIEIFAALHWYSLDCITGFLYGSMGATHALAGSEADRRLLVDILDPARRRLSWFAVHLPALTGWLYTRTGTAERLVTALGLLPMQKPATYTGIRAHALQAWERFEAAEDGAKHQADSVMGILWKRQQKLPRGLRPRAMASELADHFLAGIDTTSDAVMFAVWALSRPEHAGYQARLAAEVAAPDVAIDDAEHGGNPTAEAADRLPFLDAVIRETLRLYAPLPASEPRRFPPMTTTAVVAGVTVPPGTVVSMAPYTLHRNPAVFPEPLAFRPERWLGEKAGLGDVAEMRKWFWAFSSGGRMCIGMHLAMAEMTMLLAALYRKYSTTLPPSQQAVSPGITSRFEVFGDDTMNISEHECWVCFEKR